eukprot:3900866-Pyramimonas_sp.AAC.1
MHCELRGLQWRGWMSMQPMRRARHLTCSFFAAAAVAVVELSSSSSSSRQVVVVSRRVAVVAVAP